MNYEFYIGWEAKAPPAIGSGVRLAVVLLLALAGVLGVLLSLAPRTIGVSVFEWGKVKSFSGIPKSQPFPHLLVPRPGVRDFHTLQSVESSPAGFSSYCLVKPLKFAGRLRCLA